MHDLSSKFAVEIFDSPPTEEAKKTTMMIYDELSEAGLSRGDTVRALTLVLAAVMAQTGKDTDNFVGAVIERLPSLTDECKVEYERTGGVRPS